MSPRRILVLAGLTILLLLARGRPAEAGTLSNLMEVLEEDKREAVYDMNLNAPFTKESSGYTEDISVETGTLRVTRTELTLPGRNGFDLVVATRYESNAAKLFDENVQATWTGATGEHVYGQTIVAYYEVFRASDNYWLRSDWVAYAANQTIAGSYVVGTERWVFTGYLYLEADPGNILATNDTGNISFSNTPSGKSAFVRSRYSLGEGWRFALPALETSQVNPSAKFLHLANGTVYRTGASSASGLEGYELQDLVFSADTSYSNGSETSAYRLRRKDGRETFFSASGGVIGIRDRFGNDIRYFYGTDAQGLPRLSQIIDCAGRVVSIGYLGDNVSFSTGERKLTYVRTPVSGYAGKYYLSGIVDPQGRQISLTYSLDDAQFWVLGNSAKTAVNKYANLSEVTWPTGAKTTYEWIRGTKNLGLPGKMDYYRVSNRADTVGGVAANSLSYAYENEPDGYPTYDSSALPTTYTYATTVTGAAGLAERHLFDYEHHNTVTVSTGPGVSRSVETTYDATLGLPIQTVTTLSGAGGAGPRSYRTTVYDVYGDLRGDSSPYAAGGPLYSERLVEYTYDPSFHVLILKRYRRDAVTLLEWKGQLTSDRKAVAAASLLENGQERARTTFTYDAYGNRLTETRLGQSTEAVTTRYGYDPRYQAVYLTTKTVEGVSDPDGLRADVSESCSYDFASGWPVATTDANGNTKTYVYDKIGRPTLETLPSGETRRWAYDDQANRIVATDEAGYERIYSFDGLGRPLRVTDVSTGLTLSDFAYDDAGRVYKWTDGNGNYWLCAYDALDRPLSVQRYSRSGLLVAATSVAYDDAFVLPGVAPAFDAVATPPAADIARTCRRVVVTQEGAPAAPSLRQACYYDESGFLVLEGRISRSREDYQVYVRDYLGNTTASIDYLGHTTRYRLDYAGRVVEERGPDGGVGLYSYDSRGNLLSRTDPTGDTTRYWVDALNRVVKEVAPFDSTGPSLRKNYYDPNGNLVRIVDPVGRTIDCGYDSSDRLARMAVYPDSRTTNITRYAYDAVGNVAEITAGLSADSDPVFSTLRYSYDSLGRLTRASDALGIATFQAYDGCGNLLRRIDGNGLATLFSYDALNRLVRRSVAKDGRLDETRFAYHFVGARASMVDETGRTTYQYDELGRLTHERGPGGIEKRQTFDASGQRTSLDVSWHGRTVLALDFGYDTLDRLVLVDDQGARTTYEYDADGRLAKTVNNAIGLTEALYRNAAGLPVAQEVTWGSEIVQVLNCEYDPSGNMTRKTAPEGITRYDYDGLGRLSRAEYPDGRAVDYYFDDSGNRIRRTETATFRAGDSAAVPRETSYAYDRGDRLLAVDERSGDARTLTRFEYDRNGNQVAKLESVYEGERLAYTDSWDFHFDGLNRLDEVVRPDGERYRYTYNGYGLRVGKTDGQRLLTYVYDGRNVVLETLDAQPEYAVTTRGKRLISRTAAGRTSYYVNDLQGSVMALVEADHSEVAAYQYDAFGLSLAGSDAAGPSDPFDLTVNPYLFNGEARDAETGLYYLKARYYDPDQGRFVSEDPLSSIPALAMLSALRRYVFAGGNPVNLSDPSGFITQSATAEAEEADLAAEPRQSQGATVALLLEGLGMVATVLAVVVLACVAIGFLAGGGIAGGMAAAAPVVQVAVGVSNAELAALAIGCLTDEISDEMAADEIVAILAERFLARFAGKTLSRAGQAAIERLAQASGVGSTRGQVQAILELAGYSAEEVSAALNSLNETALQAILDQATPKAGTTLGGWLAAVAELLDLPPTSEDAPAQTDEAADDDGTGQP